MSQAHTQQAIRHDDLSNRHFRESSGAIILLFDDELSSQRLSGDPLRSCSLAAVGGVNIAPTVA
jgi:hypothetical protein